MTALPRIALPKLGTAPLTPVQRMAETVRTANMHAEPPQPTVEPTLADALASVTDPKLKAMLAAALAAAPAAVGSVPDPNAKPPLLFWLSDDEKVGYVASAWKPSTALLGSAQEPATYRGALSAAGAHWSTLPNRNGRRWGFWHGRSPLVNAACKILLGQGWRVIHVGSLADAEARADAELAQAPMVPVAARSGRSRGPALPSVAANAPLDLTGFEA